MCYYTMRKLAFILFLQFLLVFSVKSQDLQEYFPLKLFFANDEPNPRSIATSTNLSYNDTYQSYEKQFDAYLKEGEHFQYLLDNEIIPNQQKIKGLKQTLVDSLKTGKRIVLQVKGFASPLHKSDYNVNISKRRISSFINELTSNKEVLRYIENKHLLIEALPFGEYSAHESVNDDLDSTHLSVYHMQASYERRIEAELIAIQDLEQPFLYAETTYFDAGKVKQGETVKHSFNIENLGLETLLLEQIAVSCGCSVAETKLQELKSREATQLDIEIDTKQLILGKQVKSITVLYNNGLSKRFVVLLEVV